MQNYQAKTMATQQDDSTISAIVDLKPQTSKKSVAALAVWLSDFETKNRNHFESGMIQKSQSKIHQHVKKFEILSISSVSSCSSGSDRSTSVSSPPLHAKSLSSLSRPFLPARYSAVQKNNVSNSSQHAFTEPEELSAQELEQYRVVAITKLLELPVPLQRDRLCDNESDDDDDDEFSNPWPNQPNDWHPKSSAIRERNDTIFVSNEKNIGQGCHASAVLGFRPKNDNFFVNSKDNVDQISAAKSSSYFPPKRSTTSLSFLAPSVMESLSFESIDHQHCTPKPSASHHQPPAPPSIRNITSSCRFPPELSSTIPKNMYKPSGKTANCQDRLLVSFDNANLGDVFSEALLQNEPVAAASGPGSRSSRSTLGQYAPIPFHLGCHNDNHTNVGDQLSNEQNKSMSIGWTFEPLAAMRPTSSRQHPESNRSGPVGEKKTPLSMPAPRIEPLVRHAPKKSVYNSKKSLVQLRQEELASIQAHSRLARRTTKTVWQKDPAKGGFKKTFVVTESKASPAGK